MSWSHLVKRDLVLIVLTVLFGSVTIGGLIAGANADSLGASDAPLLKTAPLSLPDDQSKETDGEDPLVQEMAIKYYTKKYKVKPDVARKRIEIQDKASGIEDKIADLLGDDFAGIWYDARREGRVQIGLVRGARGKLPDVRRLVKEFDVATVADVVNVRYSIAELEKKKDRVARDLSDMISAGHARVGYNTKSNGVRVTVISALDRGERLRIRRLRATPGVYIRESRAKSLKVRFDQCAVRKCDPPMRGGREITSPSRCTAGFVARFGDNPNVLGVLTAGHCIFGTGGNDVIWSSDNQAGNSHALGPARKYFFAGPIGEDEGIIRIDGSGFWGSPQAVGRVVVKGSDDTTYNPNYHIHNDSMSSIGQILCMTGRATGTHCGEVDDLGEEICTDLNGESYTLKNMGELDICEAQGGDSGGPLYKNKKAYGLHSSTGFEDLWDCDQFYQGIRGAQRRLNVSLVFND